MEGKVNQTQHQSDEVVTIGTLPSIGSASAQCHDIERVVAYKGQGVLGEDSSFGGTLSSFGETTLDKGATDTSSSSQSYWKKEKILLLGTAIVLIIFSVVISVMGASGGLTSRKKGDPSRVEVILAEEQSGSPSLSPTLPPTVPAQWDIKFLGLAGDFSVDSTNELVVDYEIGINRVYETEIFTRDCSSPLTGIVIDLMAERKPKDDYTEFLSLKYSIDKTSITRSNIWNEATDQLQLCQVVHLVHPSEDGSGPDFVIVEDKRTLDVDIDLSVNFNMGLVVELAPGPEEEEEVSLGGDPNGGGDPDQGGGSNEGSPSPNGGANGGGPPN